MNKNSIDSFMQSVEGKDIYIESITKDSEFEDEMFYKIFEIDDEISRKKYTDSIIRKCKKLGRKKEFLDLLKAWNKRYKAMEKHEKSSPGILPSFYDGKGNIIPSLLADAVSKEIGYRQFQKMSYKYMDDYYHEVSEEESLLNYISQKLPPEKRRKRILDEVLSLMKIANNIGTKDKPNLNIINTKSGLLNLDTMELVSHSQDYFTTFQVPCEYPSKKKYEGSRFQQYIKTTFWEGAEPLIQEIFGAGLQPDPKKMQQCIFLLGEGSNGKSLMINILKALFGDNVSTVPLKDIDGNRFALSAMVGKNVNIDGDATGVRIEDDGNFKKITSGDAVFLEQKNKPGISGVLNNILYVGLNKMPSTSDKSYGAVRRNVIIPFETEFVKEGELPKNLNSKRYYTIDKTLENDIINNELDVVLQFALEGLQRLKKNNYTFTYCKEVEDATEIYRQDVNSAYAFYVANKEGSHEYSQVRAKDLYDIYKEWCLDNEIDSPMSATGFGREISKYYKKKRTKKSVIYSDIVLAENNDAIIIQGLKAI